MGQTKAMRFCIFNTCQFDRLTRGGGVFLGILGGGVPPDSPNPDPISDQKMSFPHPFSPWAQKFIPFFRRTWAEIMSSLVRSERQQKNS